MWSTSQQDCLNVEPGVSRLTTWKLLIRAFSPEGEGGTRVTSTAWVETWNWEVWGRKAGCWRKLTCPPWQSRHMWDPGLSDSHLWNAPLPQCAEPLSQSRSGLFYIAESRYAAVLAYFQAAWWHRRPTSSWLSGGEPCGSGPGMAVAAAAHPALDPGSVACTCLYGWGLTSERWGPGHSQRWPVAQSLSGQEHWTMSPCSDPWSSANLLWVPAQSRWYNEELRSLLLHLRG